MYTALYCGTGELLLAKAIELPVADATFFFDASLTLHKITRRQYCVLPCLYVHYQKERKLYFSTTPFQSLFVYCFFQQFLRSKFSQKIFFQLNVIAIVYIPCKTTNKNIMKDISFANKLESYFIGLDSQLKQGRLRPIFVQKNLFKNNSENPIF